MPFEYRGCLFEYAGIPTKDETRPPGSAAPGPSIPAVLVMVRKPGEKEGPAILFWNRTAISTEHAIEVARRFWTTLTE
jgi:hypothetical protein